MLAGEPKHPAHIEHAFYLLVDTAYGLNLTLLIHRAGDSDFLTQAKSGEDWIE